MTTDRLTYLHDHLAGARFAIELLEGLAEQSIDSRTASLARRLISEIAADREVLEQIADSLGGAKSSKDLVSWVTEKLTRFKLNPKSHFGLFEAVEFLSLGVQGKLALWNALQISANQTRFDFAVLKSRAIEQFSALEDLRLFLASIVLMGWDSAIESPSWQASLVEWSQSHGVLLKERTFAAGKAGEFDGKTISMNSSYDADERLYYTAHALGSMVIWSRDQQRVQGLFDELRDAKNDQAAPDRLRAAIERYRDFERESSEYAVWILTQIGAEQMVASYSNFMRADIQAMTEFHETGKAPVWREFFAKWNAEVNSGTRKVSVFVPKAVANFQAISIEKQEILQQQ